MGSVNSCGASAVDQTEVGAAVSRLQLVAGNLSEEASYLADRISAVLRPSPPLTDSNTKESEAGCLLAELLNVVSRNLEATCTSLYGLRNRVEL